MGAEIKRREHAERPVRQRSSTLIEADEEIDGTWWRMRRRSSARGLRESFVLVAISVIFFHPGSSWAQGPLEVRRSQPRAQQELSAEDVQRQIPIVTIVAMEETPLLLPVQRIVSGIQVQDDFLRRFPVGLEENIH